MAIDVVCRFVGGPQGNETQTLHQHFCLDTLSLEIGWLKPTANGGTVIVKGERPRNVDWLSATKAVYEKVSPVSGGQATYEFVRLEEVRRCDRFLESKNRQCRHEAAAGSNLCLTHQPRK